MNMLVNDSPPLHIHPLRTFTELVEVPRVWKEELSFEAREAGRQVEGFSESFLDQAFSR
jgi:hypothetical protein